MPGKTKTTKAKKTSSSKKQKKVVEPVQEKIVETPVVEAPVQDTQEESCTYDQEFSELNSRLKDAMNIVRAVITDMNKLEKRVTRDRKRAAIKHFNGSRATATRIRPADVQRVRVVPL